MRLLDLFCCEGGAGMGYHRAGFEVVGGGVVTECEHGDPHPERCALCRRREVARIAPHRLRPLTRHPAPQRLTEKPVPRPIWYEALVAEAREEARRVRPDDRS